jgi:hypothetical protein
MFHHVGHSRDVAITWHEGCSPIFNRIWRLDLDLHRGLMRRILQAVGSTHPQYRMCLLQCWRLPDALIE